MTAFWHRPFSTQGTWNEKIRKLGKSTKIEVGVLTNENPIRPEELSLGGMLATVDENSKSIGKSLHIFLLRRSANFPHQVQPASHFPLVTIPLPNLLAKLTSHRSPLLLASILPSGLRFRQHLCSLHLLGALYIHILHSLPHYSRTNISYLLRFFLRLKISARYVLFREKQTSKPRIGLFLNGA